MHEQLSCIFMNKAQLWALATRDMLIEVSVRGTGEWMTVALKDVLCVSETTRRDGGEFASEQCHSRINRDRPKLMLNERKAVFTLATSIQTSRHKAVFNAQGVARCIGVH